MPKLSTLSFIGLVFVSLALGVGLDLLNGRQALLNGRQQLALITSTSTENIPPSVDLPDTYCCTTKGQECSVKAVADCTTLTTGPFGSKEDCNFSCGVMWCQIEGHCQMTAVPEGQEPNHFGALSSKALCPDGTIAFATSEFCKVKLPKPPAPAPTPDRAPSAPTEKLKGRKKGHGKKNRQADKPGKADNSGF